MSMPQHIFYAYVDGSDLEEIESQMVARFQEFVSSRQWIVHDVWVVNQKHGEESGLQPGDLEPWDLGLNLELPDLGAECPIWFLDVEAVVQFLGKMHIEFRRDFVLGIADTRTEVAEDLFSVDTSSPDLNWLRRMIIGV